MASALRKARLIAQEILDTIEELLNDDDPCQDSIQGAMDDIKKLGNDLGEKLKEAKEAAPEDDDEEEEEEGD